LIAAPANRVMTAATSRCSSAAARCGCASPTAAQRQRGSTSARRLDAACRPWRQRPRHHTRRSPIGAKRERLAAYPAILRDRRHRPGTPPTTGIAARPARQHPRPRHQPAPSASIAQRPARPSDSFGRVVAIAHRPVAREAAPDHVLPMVSGLTGRPRLGHSAACAGERSMSRGDAPTADAVRLGDLRVRPPGR
jgi:hypothetical protein